MMIGCVAAANFWLVPVLLLLPVLVLQLSWLLLLLLT
jgi:hypothetical protein